PSGVCSEPLLVLRISSRVSWRAHRMSRQARFHLVYWLAAIFGLLVLQYFYTLAQRIEAIPYSQFQQLLHDGKVAEAAISDRYIQGRLGQPLPSGKSQFVTTRVDPEFANQLQKYN